MKKTGQSQQHAEPAATDFSQIRRKRHRNLLLGILFIVLLTVVNVIEVSALQQRSLLLLALINFNITLLFLLVVLVLRNVIKLLFERRDLPFHARFRVKLFFVTLALSLIPSLLLFGVASNLISESLNNWFNPRIEIFLTNALGVVHSYNDTTRTLALHYAEEISATIRERNLMNESRRRLLQRVIEEKLREYRLGLVQIFDGDGREISRAVNPDMPAMRILAPESAYLQQAMSGEPFFTLDPLDEGELLRAGLPVYSRYQPNDIVGVVTTNLYLPASLSDRIHQIGSDYERYKQQHRRLFETKGVYLSILAIFTLTIVFSATWLSLYVSRGITTPIEQLAETTKAVAQGDLNIHLDIQAYDEVQILVHNFNRMIEKLRTSKEVITHTYEELQQTNEELEQRRRDMESVLENIATGVISVDMSGTIRNINRAVGKMLSIMPERVWHRTYEHALRNERLAPLRTIVARSLNTPTQTFRENIRIEDHRVVRNLSVTAAPMVGTEEEITGILIVLEDMTELVKIQRVAAWQEVARRIAHEIKNPLTPIQISAERLQRRFRALPEAEASPLLDLTHTIIEEVHDLKGLVNEFSRFARMPEADPQPNDLHRIIENTVSIYRATTETIRFTLTLDPDLPTMPLDPEHIKRLLVNLIDNAVEAMKGKGKLDITTRFDRVLRLAILEIADYGPGIRAEEREKLFLPQFSTKKGGMGLGLAIVNRIVSDHNGFIRVQDNRPHGTRFIIELPVVRASLGKMRT